MLNVEDVSVRYGRIQAVREVCLLVEPGEIVALLGANGAGKSSLMRTVAGLQRPSSGQIFWDGKRLDGLASHQVVASGVVLVPEGRQLLPTMTVQENLLLGSYSRHVGNYRELLGPIGLYIKGDSVQESLRYVFSLFPRLEERQGQLAGSLSGGEQQMLAIGRGLMASPSLLLLDEPSVGLAPNLVREILGLLERLRGAGLTVLLVEQDAHAALRIADRAYVMETGRIAAEGESQELLDSDRMRRAYLGMA